MKTVLNASIKYNLTLSVQYSHKTKQKPVLFGTVLNRQLDKQRHCKTHKIDFKLFKVV